MHDYSTPSRIPLANEYRAAVVSNVTNLMDRR
jgi:hypothetical protein